MRLATLTIALVCTAGLSACSTSPAGLLNQDLVVALSGDTQAITDVEGPYGGALIKKHAVAIRVWPNSLDDGLAEVSVFVTNGSWNTLTVGVEEILVTSGGPEIEILGKEEMLASLSGHAEMPGTMSNSGMGPSSDSVRLTEAGVFSGSQKSGNSDGSTFNSGISEAAQRASSNRRPTSGSSNQSTAEKRVAIENWYLDRMEVYPGDTGTGGISVPLPNQSETMQLIVRLDGETYTFDLEYTRTR